MRKRRAGTEGKRKEERKVGLKERHSKGQMKEWGDTDCTTGECVSVLTFSMLRVESCLSSQL